MTITAKYPGICRRCGQPIHQGDKIEWARGEKPYHTTCPQQQKNNETTYSIGGGEGYGYSEYKKGQIIRNKTQRIEKGEPEFLYVLSASHRYYSDEGMSFGVGDEQGYVFNAICRAATEEESAPLAAKIQENKQQKNAREWLAQVEHKIFSAGNFPEQPIADLPTGEMFKIDNGNPLYGAGRWFIIEGNTKIWLIINNGADGDNWAATNIGTPGYSGYIGKFIPWEEKIEIGIRQATILANYV